MNALTKPSVSIFAAWYICLSMTFALPAEARKGVRPMDLDCAARSVAEKTGGKILAADTVKTSKGSFFRIKVLTPGGHVRYVQIREDAKCEY